MSPPAEKPFPGVPVVGLSCVLRQKLEGSLKSCPPLFFCCCFSFYFLNISSREPEITRTVSPAVIVLFSGFIAIRVCETTTNRLFRAPLYRWRRVCARARARPSQRSVKQNSLIRTQAVAEQRGPSGEPRPPNCVSHEQSSEIS